MTAVDFWGFATLAWCVV